MPDGTVRAAEGSLDGTLRIAQGCNGPRLSGNGGYVGGLLAQRFGGDDAVEVTFRSPIPIEKPLALWHSADGLRLLDGDVLICEARAGSVSQLAPPAPPSDWREVMERDKDGGCFEDSRPTTHAEPTYRVHDSVFYCVANMPGAVPHTSTYALTNVTLPYAIELANRGWRDALRRDHALALGLNTHEGQLTNGPVAEAHGYDAVALDDVLV